MYTESDWARTFYSLGGEFDAHPAWELHADALPGKPLINTTDVEIDENGNSHTYSFRAYDFSVAAARDAWVARVTKAVAASGGALNGAFIDGNRGGWSSGILAGTTPAHAAAWAAGLNASHRALASALGPGYTLISNYATDEALAVCGGGMMERGGAGESDIETLQALGARTRHRDLGTFNATIAAFLVGMGQYSYYGRGAGWSGAGPDACSKWLEWMPEFSKPLGAPTGKAANPAPGVYTRAFATGTRVFVNTTKGGGHCVWWSDGSVTGDAATCARAPPA